MPAWKDKFKRLNLVNVYGQILKYVSNLYFYLKELSTIYISYNTLVFISNKEIWVCALNGYYVNIGISYIICKLKFNLLEY